MLADIIDACIIGWESQFHYVKEIFIPSAEMTKNIGMLYFRSHNIFHDHTEIMWTSIKYVHKHFN